MRHAHQGRLCFALVAGLFIRSCAAHDTHSEHAQNGSHGDVVSLDQQTPVKEDVSVDRVAVARDVLADAQSLRPLDVEQQYLACGCGCCGGISSAETACVDTAHGETLESIRRDDERARNSPHCAAAGCSRGRLYRLCP